MFTIFKLYWCLIYFCIELIIFTEGYGERTKDKMYEKISATSVCFRRLNATHQIGCSSKRGGSIGIIHFCESLNDLKFILINGTASSYIPVIPLNYLNGSVMRQLTTSQKISGVMFYYSNQSFHHFSQDYQCPNPLSNFPNTCNKLSPWNPYGTGLLYEDINFPVFYIEKEEEILKIKRCFQQFNNYSYGSQDERSLCSIELKSFMFATTNTPTCRRRSNIISNLNPIKLCDPLGDNNIWASLYPLVQKPKNTTTHLKNYRYIVIAARLDTTSLFEKTSGANSPVTGMITLLATAKYLKEILTDDDIKEAQTNILFFLFNGETYDYIGSQRILYDMVKGDFPINHLDNDNILPSIRPEDIRLFIEISQLGNHDERKLYIHHLNELNEITNFYNKVKKYGTSLQFEKVSFSVPPASLHTFLKYDEYFPGLIISDHDTSYRNNFYNSIFDDASNLRFVYHNETSDISDNIQLFIANVSITIGKAVYETIKDEEFTGPTNAENLFSLVNELFYCYLENPNCKVLNATQRGVVFPNIPLSLYVGVDHSPRYSTSFTAYALGWLTGDMDKNNTNCTNVSRNYAFQYCNMSVSLDKMNVTVCFKMTMNTTEAVSPAFKIPGYNWFSGNYSTWTESTWSEISVKIFLKPSCTHEKMNIAIGSISVIFSLLLVYIINSRSHILFVRQSPIATPTNC